MVEELDIYRWLDERSNDAPSGQVWIGDDAAVLPGPGDTDLLAAVDTVVSGVHFDPSTSSLADVGWRAVAVNVSDIAAMGGTPRRLLCTITAPKGADPTEILGGVLDAAKHWGCTLVGGDLSTGPLSVSVTALGDVPKAAAVLRTGARPGDSLFVTGALGAAAAGLAVLSRGDGATYPGLAMAHRRPEARVEAGWAARAARASAMIDISDGLCLDASRLAAQSRVRLEIDDVPVATRVVESGGSEEMACSGGDDYELLFTAPSVDSVLTRFETETLPPPILIGRCVEGEGVTVRGEDRSEGFRHSW